MVGLPTRLEAVIALPVQLVEVVALPFNGPLNDVAYTAPELLNVPILENAPVLVCVPAEISVPTVMLGVPTRLEAVAALPVQFVDVVAFPVSGPTNDDAYTVPELDRVPMLEWVVEFREVAVRLVMVALVAVRGPVMATAFELTWM